MLNVFFGTDSEKVRGAAHAHLETCVAKGMVVRRLDTDNFTEEAVSSHMNASSLFGETSVCLIDVYGDDGSIREVIIRHGAQMVASAHSFLVMETTLLADEKKKLTQCGATLFEYKREKQETFNVFGLTDAFVRRDKKALWVLLQDAWHHGVSNEEIVGILFWQVKMIRLAGKTKNADEAKQKSFVYDKAKRALAKFSLEESERMSEELLNIYHAGHAGLHDTSLALEKWVLSL
jgi:hypothetical protein